MQFVTVHISGKPEGQTFVLAERDFDPAKHTVVKPKKAAPKPADLPNLADLNATDAKAAIEAADVSALPALKLTEEANPKFEGGRKSVLDAINARMAG